MGAWDEEAAEKLLEQLETLQGMGGSHLAAFDLRLLLGCFLLVAGVGARMQPEAFGLGGGLLAALSRQLEGRGSDEGVAFLSDLGPQGLETLAKLAEHGERTQKGDDSDHPGPLPLLHSITKR